MSRDIRSFFQLKKPQITKLEEDESIPESPDVHIKNKRKESRKKRVLCDDSDEEIFDKKKKKSNDKSKDKHLMQEKKLLKEIKAEDVFGASKIKRSEPLVKKSKKTETGIHSDDDFDKSLLEHDHIEEVATKESSANTNGCSKVPDEDVQMKNTSVNKSDIEKNNKSPKQSRIDKSPKSSKKISIEKKFSDKQCDVVKQECESKKEDNLSVEASPEKYKPKVESVKKNQNKRNFSEFTEDSSLLEDNQLNSSSIKKKKLDKSLNESALTDEERHERKMHSAALYQKFLNRSGPKHLGAKEIPEGTPDCLKDCAFLLTGVLDSFEREEVAEAIAKYGGCVKNSISKKVTHVLAGEEAGPMKLAKAQELGIKVINEDDFLQMIREGSQKKSNAKTETEKEIKREKTAEKSKRDQKSPKVKLKSEPEHQKVINGNNIKTEKPESTVKSHKTVKSEKKEHSSKYLNNEPCSSSNKEVKIKTSPENKKSKEDKHAKEESSIITDKPTSTALPIAYMWVDKYKPQNLKQIIGQHGDASNVKKLCNWLTKWYVNRKAKLPKPSPWAKNDDGGYYKAALLSGPPGVGKTTTVSLVCKELGFDMVELNASDTRNKTLMKEQIGELLTTTSLSAYAKGETGKQAVTKKHVLVMDEVDGMAGNEDRGGLQELIGLIKSTSVPIICMCNDRNSQKMRSLVNYCYDLRFSRPRVDQIKSAMLSICFKEGVKIPPESLTQLIIAANQDVRQTLNLLSMWAIDPNTADADRLNKDAKNIKKDIKLGPWEAVRKVFSAEEHKSMSIHDKSDLFFYDYSLAPLFVQENYLQVSPHCPKHELLERISKAADSISMGDLVGAKIRGGQNWSLLPLQAMFSSVMPGHHMAGHVAGQVQFPGWLGKNSRANKMHRLCQEIHAHTRLSTSGSKSSIFLDYASHLRDAVLRPLARGGEGVELALAVLRDYHLLRDDLDALLDLSLWPGQKNPMLLVDSKVKAAMTRAYNKTAAALPYAPPSARRARATEEGEDGDGEGEREDGEDAEEENDSDLENDALIKKMKTKETEKSTKAKAGSSKDKPSTSKEKGKKKK